MPPAYRLPGRLEGAGLMSVAAEILALRGADLDLDGSGVERLNGMGLQMLLAAFKTWREDARVLRLTDPSPCLLDIFIRLGLEDSLLGEAA